MFVEEKKTWTSALSHCRDIGWTTDLVSIQDEDTNDFLLSLASDKDFWIGGFKDTSLIGKWYWSDGSEWNFQKWDTGNGRYV